MEQLEDIVRGALYTEVRALSDGKSIVMDPETEHLYYRKKLSVYSVPVFRFLKEHTHKNLPSIHLFWKEEGNLIVIEELIQGKTLDSLIDQKSMPFEEKKRILLEICDGLQFLHGAKPPIIHRDIKASNIMVTEDGTVKIIDYDAAKQFVAEKTKDTVLMGTQGVAAPEQYGFGQSDERTDIYALGKLLERMIPESAHAREIVRKATRLEPDQRYGNVAEMRQHISRLWDPSIPDSVHRKEQLKKGLKDRRFRWTVLAMALAALLIGGILIFKNKIYPEYFEKRPAYNKGIELMAEGDYEGAIEQFNICGLDYENAELQVRACEMEMGRHQYETDAKNKVEAWKNTPVNVKETEALEACARVLEEGLDNGEFLADFCSALLQEAEHYVKEQKVGQASPIIVTLARALKGKGGKIETVRTDTIEAYRKLLYDAGEYEAMARLYAELSGIDGKDYSREITDCTYQQALKELENGAYTKAADTFLSIFDYKDSAVQKRKCNYLQGKKLMETRNYKEAVKQFNLADDYEDAAEMANICKYDYCQDHQDEPDDQTRYYLDDLKKAGFTGVTELATAIETWKVSFDVKELSSDEVTIDLKFYGGPKDGMKGYRAICHTSDGASNTYTSTRTIRSGNSDSLKFQYHGSGRAYNRIKSIEIYDPEGHIIGKYNK